MKNSVRNALANLDQVVHVEKVELHYVPGADSQADAVIEQALEAARAGSDNHWINRFRDDPKFRESHSPFYYG